MIKSDANSDWIFDYVLQFLKSTEWDAAVMGFIDNNCAIFVNDEENKFEYSNTHRDFVATVEDIIDEQLGRIGITVDQFVVACEKARNSRDINREVYEQMVAMDDFLTFKKLMVKRNVELGYEALQELQKELVPILAPATEQEAEIQFQRAVKESEDEAFEPMSRPGLEVVESREEKDQGYVVDKDLRAAIDQNLMEMELLHKREEMEQLELEQAIAESLAIESERIQGLGRHECEIKQKLPEIGKAEKKKEPGGLPDSECGHHDASIPLLAESKLRPRENKEDAVQQKYNASEAEQTQAVESREAFSKRVSDEEYDEKYGSRRADRANDQKNDIPNVLQSNNPVMTTSAKTKLPSILELEDDMRRKRQAAEQAFRRNQALLLERRTQKREMQAQAGVTSDDIVRRQFKLQEQRDRILAKKNAERNDEVLRARKENVQTRPSLPSRNSRCDSMKANSDEAQSQIGHKSDDRRAMMRIALARRMKQDLLESEEERLRKMQSEQFTELDRKLRLVEQLRDENRIKEVQLSDAIAIQQKERFKNIQISAAKLSNESSN